MYEDNPNWDRDYGKEWRYITKAAKKAAGHKCNKCKKLFRDVELDTHHIKPVSEFLAEGWELEGVAHYCFGVLTTKAWNVEPNIEVLCCKHHAEHHPHLAKKYENMEIIGNYRVYKNTLEKFK